MFKKANAYGQRVGSYDVLKLIALLTMIIDHMGMYFWPDDLWLRAIGRTAFPVFLFLVGYSGKWTVKSDLIISGLVIIVFAALTHHRIFSVNVLISIMLTRWSMQWIAKKEMNIEHLAVVFMNCLIWYPLFLWTDYSTAALLFAVCGYLYRQKSPYATFVTAIVITVHYIMQYYSFEFTGFSMLLLAFSFCAVLYLLRDIQEHNFLNNDVPLWFETGLRWCARNTLPLYVFHVILFMLIERFYFPGRLAEFHWI